MSFAKIDKTRKYYKIISARMKMVFKTIFVIIILGYLLPNKISSPIEIENITKIDPESFWYYPWGELGVHKGLDIFCDNGTKILSPVNGVVYKSGYGTISGNFIYIIGAKWRTYYFAHLDTILVNQFQFVAKGNMIGKVGNTGNATNRPSHLHYSVETLFPYFWLYDRNSMEGWKKMFYLNPMEYLNF